MCVFHQQIGFCAKNLKMAHLRAEFFFREVAELGHVGFF
jgi:hypothetical protein